MDQVLSPTLRVKKKIIKIKNFFFEDSNLDPNKPEALEKVLNTPEERNYFLRFLER
jgi:hypothetical protein